MPTSVRSSWTFCSISSLGTSPGLRETVTPATVTEPESISSRQLMQRRKVDLPQPEGPIIEARSPSRMVKLMFLRTSPSSKLLQRFSIIINGLFMVFIYMPSSGFLYEDQGSVSYTKIFAI